MYDPNAVLERISDHTWPVVVLAGLSLVFNYAWYAEEIRLARRDRCYTMAPTVTMIYLAHDGSYLLLYDKWFNDYDHWFAELFWFAILFTFAGELIIFAQTLTYGRAELCPGLSQRAFVAVMICGAGLTAGAWAAVKSGLDDDIYLLSFMATIFVAAPMGSAVMFRRRSNLGLSRWLWISFTGIPIAYGLAATLYFGPDFHSTAWIALVVATCTWAVFNAWLADRIIRANTSTGTSVLITDAEVKSGTKACVERYGCAALLLRNCKAVVHSGSAEALSFTRAWD